MKQTGDLSLVKKMNTAIVLDAVLRHAPLSRAQISERTGLNKATVSSLVQDLIDSHLVLDLGPGESSGGRKPNLLQFRSRSGHAVGIDLGVNYIRGILTDLEGCVVAERRIALKAHDAKSVIPQLLACIEALRGEIPPCPYGMVGIGIGVPGLVNEDGTILFAPNLSWTEVPLRAIAEERFGVPVTIDNEANAGAQGEQRYGAGRGIANQIYVSAGIGIGTGMILNKELYKGSGGFSGELGHLSIHADGKPCRCGNRGCWELYASENALLEQAEPLGFHDLDGLLEAAGQGREDVVALFERIGEALGVGIANIVNVFNPDVVIIGNEMRRAEAWIGGAVQRTVAARALAHHQRKLKVLFAEQGEKSAVRGAAYYAISSFLAKMKGSGA
ncbi:ROK family transcriptional regulator [Paenibacillus glycinis]|nr:ROK family transcriptional regulator [Paenibacillus glycinis]